MSKEKIEHVKRITKKVEGRIAPEEAELLYHLAGQFECEGEIVEIGSYQGYSTIWLASGSKEANMGKVYAVDPHNMTDHGFNEAIFRKNIEDANLDDHVVPVISTSSEAEKTWSKPIRLLFIDGAHDYESAKNDFVLWEKHVIQYGIIAFHDFLSMTCPGVTKVVREHIFNSDNYVVVGCVNTVIYAKKVAGLSDEEEIKKDNVLQALMPRFRMEDDYQKALALIGESHNDEAIQLLQECECGVRSFFSPMYKIIRLSAIAGTYRKIGRQEEAVRIYEEVADFEDAPFIEKLAALLNLGNIYHSHSKYQDAADKFRKALSIEKISERNRFTALMGLARCNFAMKEFHEAERMFREASACNGTDMQRFHALAGVGRCCTSLRRYADAEEVYKEVLSVNNVDAENRLIAVLELGKCYNDQRKYGDEENEYLKVLTYDGVREKEGIWKYRLLNRLGNISLNHGRLDEAVRRYKDALSLKKIPGHDRYHAVLGLGRCYCRSGNYDDAEMLYNDEIGHADIPDKIKIVIAYALVDCYFARGNFNRIEDICGRMLLLEGISELEKKDFIAGVKKKINSLNRLYGGINA